MALPNFLSAHFLLAHHTSQDAFATIPQKAKGKTVSVTGLSERPSREGGGLAQMLTSLGKRDLAVPALWSQIQLYKPCKASAPLLPSQSDQPKRQGLSPFPRSYQCYRPEASGNSRSGGRKILDKQEEVPSVAEQRIKGEVAELPTKIWEQLFLPASFKCQSATETQTTFRVRPAFSVFSKAVGHACQGHRISLNSETPFP